jgi:cytochrome c oxidase subunit IV
MKQEGILFAILAVFLGGATIVYWYASKDPTGTTALALSGGLGALIAYYSLFLARRLGPRPSDRGDAEIAEAAGELGFFSPHSWWPLWLGLAAAFAATGFAMGWWLFLIGCMFTVFAAIGFVFEYYRGNFSH